MRERFRPGKWRLGPATAECPIWVGSFRSRNGPNEAESDLTRHTLRLLDLGRLAPTVILGGGDQEDMLDHLVPPLADRMTIYVVPNDSRGTIHHFLLPDGRYSSVPDLQVYLAYEVVNRGRRVRRQEDEDALLSDAAEVQPAPVEREPQEVATADPVTIARLRRIAEVDVAAIRRRIAGGVPTGDALVGESWADAAIARAGDEHRRPSRARLWVHLLDALVDAPESPSLDAVGVAIRSRPELAALREPFDDLRARRNGDVPE